MADHALKRILIVDDNPDVRNFLRASLEMHGYGCREVEHGLEALQAIRQENFDLVITDNEMPVMTGLQFLQCLAREPAHRKSPVLMLSGHLTEQVQEDARKAGVAAILPKPCLNEELLATITSIFHSSS